MAGAFSYLSPTVEEALTVYVAESRERRTWGHYLWAPFVAKCFYILSTLLMIVDGLICAIVIIPMFAFWRAMGDYLPEPTLLNDVQRSTVVHAAPERMRSHLNHTTNIKPEEFGATWAARIGMPMPLSVSWQSTPSGRVRVTHWDKAVQFDQPNADWHHVAQLLISAMLEADLQFYKQRTETTSF